MAAFNGDMNMQEPRNFASKEGAAAVCPQLLGWMGSMCAELFQQVFEPRAAADSTLDAPGTVGEQVRSRFTYKAAVYKSPVVLPPQLAEYAFCMLLALNRHKQKVATCDPVPLSPPGPQAALSVTG